MVKSYFKSVAVEVFVLRAFVEEVGYVSVQNLEVAD